MCMVYTHLSCVGPTSRTNGTTTNTCPPLFNSSTMAFLITLLSSSLTDTLTSLLPTGAVFIKERSRRFAMLICRVRGIGVADRVSTSVPPETACKQYKGKGEGKSQESMYR